MFHRKLLALACFRSGTRFLHKALRQAGVKVGHEHVTRDGLVDGFFAVEDVWYPGKHWNDDLGYEDESLQRRSHYTFDQVWHFVRDPRKVIPSLASVQFATLIWPWLERHTGISCGLYPKELRAMLMWVRWNELIEENEQIDLFFRIEDVHEHWAEMGRRLGFKPEPITLTTEFGTFEKGPRRTQPLSFDDMRQIDADAAEAVIKMAERYGYTEGIA